MNRSRRLWNLEIPAEAGEMRNWIANVERKWLTGDETVSRELASLSIKNKIAILAACGDRPSAAQRRAPTDAAQRWKNMDPVDLVPKEREKFLKGKVKIFKTPELQMKISKVPVGAKLAPWFSLQFYEMLEISSSPEELASALLPFFSVPANLFLRGSLLKEAELLALKKLKNLKKLEISGMIETVIAALRNFSPSPDLVVFMHCKVLPAALHANAGSGVLVNLLHNKNLRMTAGNLKQLLRNDTVDPVSVADAMVVGGVCDAEWLQRVVTHRPLSIDEAVRLGFVFRFFGLSNDALSERIKNEIHITEDLTAENLGRLSFGFSDDSALRAKNPDVDFDKIHLIGRF